MIGRARLPWGLRIDRDEIAETAEVDDDRKPAP